MKLAHLTTGGSMDTIMPVIRRVPKTWEHPIETREDGWRYLPRDEWQIPDLPSNARGAWFQPYDLEAGVPLSRKFKTSAEVEVWLEEWSLEEGCFF